MDAANRTAPELDTHYIDSKDFNDGYKHGIESMKVCLKEIQKHG